MRWATGLERSTVLMEFMRGCQVTPAEPCDRSGGVAGLAAAWAGTPQPNRPRRSDAPGLDSGP